MKDNLTWGEIVDILNAHAKERKISSYRIAKLINVNTSTVHRVLKKEVIPSVELAFKIINALEIEITIKKKDLH